MMESLTKIFSIKFKNINFFSKALVSPQWMRVQTLQIKTKLTFSKRAIKYPDCATSSVQQPAMPHAAHYIHDATGHASHWWRMYSRAMMQYATRDETDCSDCELKCLSQNKNNVKNLTLFSKKILKFIWPPLQHFCKFANQNKQ